MNKQLTAVLLLVAGTVTGNALASCRSCKEEPKPTCYRYEKVHVCPEKKCYYTCPPNAKMENGGDTEAKDRKASKAVKGYGNKHSKNGNKHMNGKK